MLRAIGQRCMEAWMDQAKVEALAATEGKRFRDDRPRSREATSPAARAALTEVLTPEAAA